MQEQNKRDICLCNLLVNYQLLLILCYLQQYLLYLVLYLSIDIVNVQNLLFVLLIVLLRRIVIDMQDNFDRCENIGRQKFESLLQQKGITDYHFTEDKYCPVDCYFTSPTQDKWVVEIKVRDEGVDKYSTLFMELAKWKEMDAIIKSKQAD